MMDNFYKTEKESYKHKGNRFILVNEAEHGCCYDLSIYDTSYGYNDYNDEGENDPRNMSWKQRVCEVSDITYGKAILHLLNAIEHCTTYPKDMRKQ